MSIETKWWKLVQISFSIFLCCAMYDVWVGFDDHLMIIKLLLTTFFVILIGTPILSFIQSFKKENKMRKYESIELYGQEACLYWESVEDFKKFSEEVVVRVEAELTKHKNATLETIALSSGSYSEYEDTYTYVSIVLDFERDLTQEEIKEIEDKENMKDEQKNIAQELMSKGLNVNLAYDKSFVKAYKEGLIKIGEAK